jgi:hypothetical protein
MKAAVDMRIRVYHKLKKEGLRKLTGLGRLLFLMNETRRGRKKATIHIPRHNVWMMV